MIFGLCLGIVIPALLGNLVLSFIDRDKTLVPLENLSLSFLLGEGFVAILLFWSFFLNLPYRVHLIGGIIVSAFILKVILFDRIKISVGNIPRPGGLSIVVLAALLIKIVYVFIETCSKPEYSWDASMNWTNVGKDIYYLGRMQPEQIINYLATGLNYPKQISFMHYWLFSWMGQVNDQWSKIFFPIGLVCFLVLFYYSLKKARGSQGALAFSYFLLSAPIFIYLSTIGYADFSISIYFSLGIIFFYNWIKEKQETYFWLFSIFTALAAWIKLEGKPLYILGFILLFIYLLRSGAIKALFIRVSQYLLPFLIIDLPWLVFMVFNKPQTREKLASHASHFFDLHSAIYAKLFVEGTWGVLWIFPLAAAVFFYRKLINRENIYLLSTFLLFYGMNLFIFLFTYDGYSSFEVSFNRVWLSVYPSVIFAIGNIIPRINLGSFGEI